MPLEAIIGAAGNIISGLLGGKKDEQKSAWLSSKGGILGQAEGARVASEKFGFNPLTLLGVSSPMMGNPSGNASMGNAIADSMMMLADGLAKKTDTSSGAAQQVTRLANQNATLKRKLDSQTIRPKVGGIYAQNEAVPSLASAHGRGVPDAIATENATRISENSPLAGAVHGPDDGNLTGPQHSVKKDVPAFRLFGHDFYGSGLFSTGQQMEDAIGEGPVQWAYSPVLLTDAFYNEAYKLGRNVSRDRAAQKWKQGLVDAYSRNGGQWVDGSLFGKRPKPKPPRSSKTMKPLARPSDFY